MNGLVERDPEPLQDLLALGGRRTGRDEVVVVKAHAVRADVGEMVNAVDRIEGWARLVAEGVATPIADGPEAEGEVVVGLSLVVGHGAGL